MSYLALLPLALLGAIASVVSLMVVFIDREERRRARRYIRRVARRVAFRPVVIQGGKPEPEPVVPPAAEPARVTNDAA